MTGLADLLDRLADDLADEVDRLLRRDPATPTPRLLALVAALRRTSESERIGSRHLPKLRVLSLAQWCVENGTSRATAKRRAAEGLIAGAVRVHGAGWVVLAAGRTTGATHTDGHEEQE